MGKPELAVMVGFGTELPHGTSIKTRWGVLRSRRPDDVEVLRTGGVEHDPERGSVLETRVDGPVLRHENGSQSLVHPSIEDDRWSRVALGLLLAQDPASPRPVLPWCCVSGPPGMPGGGEFRQFLKGTQVNDEQVPEVERWLGLVENSRLRDVAVSRATSMIGRLTGHVDALIDGVVVWECLFGGDDKQELGYRVSMNMAAVLSDVASERVAYQQEIKALYLLRSTIVHGGDHDKARRKWGATYRPDLVGVVTDDEVRRRVQELTLLGLRRLLGTRPDLLGASDQAFIAFLLGDAAVSSDVTSADDLAV